MFGLLLEWTESSRDSRQFFNFKSSIKGLIYLPVEDLLGSFSKLDKAYTIYRVHTIYLYHLKEGNRASYASMIVNTRIYINSSYDAFSIQRSCILTANCFNLSRMQTRKESQCEIYIQTTNYAVILSFHICCNSISPRYLWHLLLFMLLLSK